MKITLYKTLISMENKIKCLDNPLVITKFVNRAINISTHTDHQEHHNIEQDIKYNTDTHIDPLNIDPLNIQPLTTFTTVQLNEYNRTDLQQQYDIFKKNLDNSISQYNKLFNQKQHIEYIKMITEQEIQLDQENYNDPEACIFKIYTTQLKNINTELNDYEDKLKTTKENIKISEGNMQRCVELLAHRFLNS